MQGVPKVIEEIKFNNSKSIYISKMHRSNKYSEWDFFIWNFSIKKIVTLMHLSSIDNTVVIQHRLDIL